MATIEYKGYVARIDINEEDDSLHGVVTNIRDVVTFEGRNLKQLRKEFARSIEDYFKFCEERGEEPDKPFSGKFLVRVDPAVHSAIARAAHREGKSINQWVESELERAAG
jgi:predicted HicB family RNase H-like nuclease